MVPSQIALRIFTFSLFLVFVCLSSINAQIVITNYGDGIGRPPLTSVGPYTLSPLPRDTRADESVVQDLGSPCGLITFAPEVIKRAGGTTDDYVFMTNPASHRNLLNILLPPGTVAFSFETRSYLDFPLPFTVIADGTILTTTASGVLGGSTSFGIYGNDTPISSVTLIFDGTTRPADISKLAISCQPVKGVANVTISDQKPGSFLAFPYYNSRSGADTRLTITNVGTKTSNVHMFFTDASCNQADQYVCLTAKASASFLASEYDPENIGYLLAVAVDNSGQPIQDNSLIGNAFVLEGAYGGNYGAEAFWAHSAPAAMNPATMTSVLDFNNKIYDMLPTHHVAEIQSPNDSIGQRIIMAGLRGSVISGVNGAEQVGVGIAYNDGEKPGSYSNPFSDGCQRSFIVDARKPRVPGGLGSQAGINNPALIPSGRTGILTWNSNGSVGLIMTPKNATNKWYGIRTVHKDGTKVGSLEIPVLGGQNCRTEFSK